MKQSRQKLIRLVSGLAAFALLGTGLFYAAGFDKPSSPELESGFAFIKGLSVEDLHFSNNEIRKLNRTFLRNEKVVDKATLTVLGDDGRYKLKHVTKDSKLTFTIEVRSKYGMTFSPDEISCLRRALIPKVVFYLNRGAKILARYANEPVLKGREVKIIDM